MRRCLARLTCLVVVLSLVPVIRAAEEPAKTVQLFNGKDLSGWTAVSSDPNTKTEDVWSVVDGNIHCVGHPAGYLRTDQDFTAFKLKLQWRTLKKGNSGCLIRVQPPDKVWPKSIECQLNTNEAGDIWIIDDFPIKVDESRHKGRNVKKLHESSEKPLGEWNQYEITADGAGNLELKVNDVVQNTATDTAVIPGKILLQSEGAEIEFRNIELTPLPAPAATKPAARVREGPTRIFNGKDLAGWTGYFADGSKIEDSWSVSKGVLHYAGGKNGFIYTDKPYANYILKLAYRFPEKAGDSGVLLRVEPEDKIWPRSIEAQGMSGKAGDVWLLGTEKAKGDPERTKGANIRKMQPSSEKPLGEWNTYEIIANGDKAELRVNYILQNKLTDWFTQTGRIALQAQDVPVEFKDIELWPLPDKEHPAEEQRLPGLDGWHITGVGHWTYHDGIIEGQQSKDVHTYTHVVSDKSYHNFKASLKYKCPQGNSGFYFRVLVDATGNVHGFQAEIDEKRDAGGLYESWGRGWVSQPSKEDVAKHYKINDWNEMKVEASGPHVVVMVNDWKAAEINDPNVIMEGPCALQIHGGQDVHVLFKDIHIEPLPE